MKKLLVIFSCIGLLAFSTNAQHGINPSGSTVYLELGGPTLLFSFNYEHGFYLNRTDRHKINGRIGFASYNSDVFYIPIGTSIDFGRRNSFFQININRVFSFPHNYKTEINNTSFGLAYVRRPDQGFYFHASLRYHFFDGDPAFWGSFGLPWIGIGIGYSFE